MGGTSLAQRVDNGPFTHRRAPNVAPNEARGRDIYLESERFVGAPSSGRSGEAKLATGSDDAVT